MSDFISVAETGPPGSDVTDALFWEEWLGDDIDTPTILEEAARVGEIYKHLPGKHDQKKHDPHKGGGAELVYYDPDEMYEMGDPWAVADEAGIYVSSDKEVAQVAIEDGQIVGALFEAMDYPNMTYSADIAVLPESQGRGIGSMLADASVDNFRQWQFDIPDLTMEIDAVNPKAAAMLERRGAEIIGTTDHHIHMRMKEGTNDV